MHYGTATALVCAAAYMYQKSALLHQTLARWHQIVLSWWAKAVDICTPDIKLRSEGVSGMLLRCQSRPFPQAIAVVPQVEQLYGHMAAANQLPPHHDVHEWQHGVSWHGLKFSELHSMIAPLGSKGNE